MNAHQEAWTRRDEQLLRSTYPWLPVEEIADVLGRTTKAIASRAKVLRVQKAIGCGGRKQWTKREDSIIRKLYPNAKSESLAQRLGVALHILYARARALGVSKTDEYMHSADAIAFIRPGSGGERFRFPKGHVPANKGLRRPGYAPGRMAQTQFKKGQRSGMAAKNWCPIGTIRPDSDGLLRIKVREGQKGEAYGFGNTKIWPQLNRHVWEQHHGPIPAGHMVVFKDRDRSNCAIGNLELISFVENMRRNSLHNLPPELQQVIQLTGALKRKIRNREEKLYGQEHIAGSARSPVRDAGIAV